MHSFAEDVICDETNEEGSGSGLNGRMDEDFDEGQDNPGNVSYGTRRISEPDEEWSTPLAKISRLVFDHESWRNANEILEIPTAGCRKVGDEARSIAARHIIDRIREKDYLDKIQKVAPRLRSAVELLSKPDADYVYPPFRFVVNQLRENYPEIYTSVVRNVGLRIPEDMKPTTFLVSMAKHVIENSEGDTSMDWGKFTALLGLCGALAIDSIEADYSEGVPEVVDTFGLIVEQVMGEWILSEDCGGGWEGFIKENNYDPILSPIPRTIVILLLIAYVLVSACWSVYLIWSILMVEPEPQDEFWRKWGNVYPVRYCVQEELLLNSPASSLCLNAVCELPLTPLDFIYAIHPCCEKE